MRKDKKLLTLSILGILSLVLITVGVTYAFFNYAKEGTTENSITTGSITFLYTEISGVGRGISLEDAYPVSDSVGKAQTGEGKVFDFKVTSSISNNTSISYEVTARKKDTSDLSEDKVKLYLTKVTGTSEEEIVLSKYNELTTTNKVDSSKFDEKTLYKGKVPAKTPNYEQAFRLRMWIDEKVDFSDGTMNDKEFTITVNVYANAKVITEEEAELEGNNDILSINVLDKKAVTPYNKDYDYEIGLASGTTEANLDVITLSEDTSVKLEKLDSLAKGSSVKRLSNKKSVDLAEGDNYFKITTTSLIGEEKTSIINVRVGEYKENLLNQTDPVLSNNLIPVIIKDNGEVYKVDNTYTWYDYETKIWANAIVLKDTTARYNVGDLIPEEAIESYFVWIPKYSYKLWDLGNYGGFTTASSKEDIISIRFGLTNTSDSVTGECTTPGISGESGNCGVGEYMTHPAFLAFDSNGFWVGKFETGYDGALSKEDAYINSYDSNKIIIKPNVYSWRGASLGNFFKASYNYLKNDNSHPIKNTEWGAVAYLQHSNYGSATSVRLNNNSNYITGYAAVSEPVFNTENTEGIIEATSLGADGNNTKNYLNPLSVFASTTGNYTGIYDMSGGALEYAMGYSTKATSDFSEITTLYPDFFTNSNYEMYYDKYISSNYWEFSTRILGDATGELGPIAMTYNADNVHVGYRSSWYNDTMIFIPYNRPWFVRGGEYNVSYSAGIFFSFYSIGNSDDGGESDINISLRIVLTPGK